MRAVFLSVLLVAGLAEAQGLPRSSSSAAITIASGIGSSPAAAGMSLSSGVLTLQPADATHPGLVTTGAQTFAGVKTFSSPPQAASYYSASGISLVGASGNDTVFRASGSGTAGIVYISNQSEHFLSADNSGLTFQTGNTLTSTQTDGSSAVGFKFNTPSLSTTGAKIASWQNSGSEKGYIDKDGNMVSNSYKVGQNVAPIVHVNVTGAQQAIEFGTQALTAGAATKNFASAFLSAPVCVCSDATAANAVKCSTSSTVLTIAGTSTDTVAYQCFGGF